MHRRSFLTSLLSSVVVPKVPAFVPAIQLVTAAYVVPNSTHWSTLGAEIGAMLQETAVHEGFTRRFLEKTDLKYENASCIAKTIQRDGASSA